MADQLLPLRLPGTRSPRSSELSTILWVYFLIGTMRFSEAVGLAISAAENRTGKSYPLMELISSHWR